MTTRKSQRPGLRGRARRGREAAAARLGQTKDWLARARERSTVVDLGMRLYERDRQAAGTVAGSAVAFRLFLFFVPTLLVVVALLGFFAAHVSSQDASSEIGVSGVLADQIRTALTQPSTTRWTALFAGLVGMASAGRSLAKSLVLASALSWQVPARPKATVRVTAMVVGAMFSLAMFSVIVNRLRRSFGLGIASVSLVGVVVVYLVAWLGLSLTLPRATRDPGALLPGAALVGAAMGVLQAITQFYVPSRLSHASALYGSLGVTVVTLGWFFIVGRVAVLGMTVNAVIYERLGSISTLVFGLPVLRILPAKSPRFAKFFGLQGDSRHPTGGASDR